MTRRLIYTLSRVKLDKIGDACFITGIELDSEAETPSRDDADI